MQKWHIISQIFFGMTFITPVFVQKSPKVPKDFIFQLWFVFQEISGFITQTLFNQTGHDKLVNGSWQVLMAFTTKSHGVECEL